MIRRHGQRTERLCATLAAVGLARAGRAGARLNSVLGFSVSRSTVLRLVDALPSRRYPPRVWKLWEEIVPLGYKGSYQRVRAYLHNKRTSPRPVTARPPSPRTVAGGRRPHARWPAAAPPACPGPWR
ncbi:hypothetical protein GCM10010206_61010 [Streptomyces cinerochromogenes]|nr:hypothetical protein GCM10010206_61010 [Streptomyces cinerochromogenes]